MLFNKFLMATLDTEWPLLNVFRIKLIKASSEAGLHVLQETPIFLPLVSFDKYSFVNFTQKWDALRR